MRKLIYLIITLFIAVVLFPLSTSAQEEIFFIGNESGVGARAIGMGGAFVGVADDYSAVYWNPAGLGQIRRMEMNIGFSHNNAANDATILGQTYNSTGSATRLNSIGFVFPVPTYQGSMVFAAGYNRMRDFDNVLEIDSFNPYYAAFPDVVVPTYPSDVTTTIDDSLHQYESLIEEGTLNHFVLSGAVEMQRNFFLGASINFISGKDDYGLTLTETDVLDIYNQQIYEETGIIADLDNWTYTQSLVSDFSAANFKLGMLYRFEKALRIGAAVTFPTTYTITETWSEAIDEVYDGGEDAQWSENGEFEYQIQEPYALSAGASFRLLNVLLSGSVEFKDWSQAKFKTEPPKAGITKAEMNVKIKQDLEAVTRIRLGAEVFVPLINARVRAGYFQDPSPYKYAENKPDKEYLSAGASMMLDKQVMVDIGVVRGSWEQTIVDPLINATTVEEKSFNKVIGTLSIRF